MTRSGGALIKLKIIVPILCLSAYSMRDEIRDREKVQTKRATMSKTVTNGQGTDTKEIPFSRLIRQELTARENGGSCSDMSIKALQYP